MELSQQQDLSVSEETAIVKLGQVTEFPWQRSTDQNDQFTVWHLTDGVRHVEARSDTPANPTNMKYGCFIMDRKEKVYPGSSGPSASPYFSDVLRYLQGQQAAAVNG